MPLAAAAASLLAPLQRLSDAVNSVGHCARLHDKDDPNVSVDIVGRHLTSEVRPALAAAAAGLLAPLHHLSDAANSVTSTFALECVLPCSFM